MKNFALSALFLALSLNAVANDIETARQMIENGYYDNARVILNQPKIKNTPEASLLSGRIAFLEYDFADAARHYAAYRKARRNKAVSGEAELYERQLSLAESFLERVEDIAILDSISVDRNEFLSVYRLPLPAGQLLPSSALPFSDARRNTDMVFANESGEIMIWAQHDADGKTSLFETSRLNDGSWQKPELINLDVDDADVCFPFMMPDGTTLYFASDGEDSMGGLDILVASKDSSTGEYMQPSNLGMPYNSPYNDYMLAIDELNGIGWWATDRNQIEGKTTVYVFATNDLRKNISADNGQQALQRARLTNWRESQTDTQKDYDALLSEVKKIRKPVAAKAADFHLPMSATKTYTLFSEFRSKEAAAKMKAYLTAKADLDAAEKSLRESRMQFNSSRSGSLGRQIAEAEKKIEIKRTETQRLLNEVYRLEKEKR